MRGQQATKFKKQLLRKWRLSYLAVFAVPLVLFIALTLTSLSTINAHVTNANTLSMRFLHNQFDTVFEQVDVVSQDILLGSQFQQLSRSVSASDVDSLYLYQTSSTLNHLLRKGSSIVDCMIYSPSMDFYISSSTWGSLDNMALMDDFNLGWDKQRYHETFAVNRRMLGLEDATRYLAGGGVSHRILVVRPLSFAQSGWNHEFMVAFLVDTSPIFSEYLNQQQDLLIINRLTGTVLYDFTGTFTPGENAGNLKDVSLTSSSRYEGKVVTAGLSNETNVMYLVIMDRGLYFHALLVFSGLAMLYLLLALGGGWGILKWRLHKDWDTYEKAIIAAGSAVDQSSSFDSIYTPFVSLTSQLKEEKEGMSSIISNQTKSLKSHMIARLLAGSKGSVSEEALSACGIQMISDQYVVLLVCADEIEIAAEKETEVITWFEGKGYVVLPFNSCHGIALILNLPKGDEVALVGIVSTDVQMMMQAIDVPHADIACSDVVSGLSSLGEAYLQAVNVLEYERSVGSHELMRYHDLLELSSEINYSYTTEQELHLFKAIQIGNAPEALKIIKAVIDENRSMGVSPQRLRYLLFSIAGTVIRCANHLAERYKGVIPAISLPPILQADNYVQSRKEVEAIVEEVCQRVLALEKTYENEGGEQYGVYRRALAEIHFDYKNPILNVSMIADNLGVSNVLLSRVFKKYHGTNISDYITSVRIEEAKTLLTEGAMVSDVVQQCGFGSLRTFMRVFKKSENLTPGQFRDLQKEDAI